MRIGYPPTHSLAPAAKMGNSWRISPTPACYRSPANKRRRFGACKRYDRCRSCREMFPKRPEGDEVDGSRSTGIKRAKVQLSSTARKGATQ
jgi:hypothetical protein